MFYPLFTLGVCFLTDKTLVLACMYLLCDDEVHVALIYLSWLTGLKKMCVRVCECVCDEMSTSLSLCNCCRLL